MNIADKCSPHSKPISHHTIIPSRMQTNFLFQNRTQRQQYNRPAFILNGTRRSILRRTCVNRVSAKQKALQLLSARADSTRRMRNVQMDYSAHTTCCFSGNLMIFSFYSDVTS